MHVSSKLIFGVEEVRVYLFESLDLGSDPFDFIVVLRFSKRKKSANVLPARQKEETYSSDNTASE